MLRIKKIAYVAMPVMLASLLSGCIVPHHNNHYARHEPNHSPEHHHPDHHQSDNHHSDHPHRG
ncbi:hypothetical protein ACQPT2_21650 [Erwinia amylovora]